jgi:hypothetical protein
VTFHRALQGKSFMEPGAFVVPPFVYSEWHTAYPMNALVPRLFQILEQTTLSETLAQAGLGRSCLVMRGIHQN